MKRHLPFFFIIIIMLLMAQIEAGNALHKAYEWTHLLYGEPNNYQAYVTTSDYWQVGTVANITLRVTLTSKGASLDHTEIVRLRMLVQGSRFVWESADVWETGVLRNAGEFWEKTVSFYIPAEKAARGQTENLSISFELTYNEIDNIEGYSLQTIYGPTVYEAMYVGLYRPLLSIPELIAVVAVIVIITGGVTLFLTLRRKRMHVEPVKLPSSSAAPAVVLNIMILGSHVSF